jgi:hypothetical protein
VKTGFGCRSARHRFLDRWHEPNPAKGSAFCWTSFLTSFVLFTQAAKAQNNQTLGSSDHAKEKQTSGTHLTRRRNDATLKTDLNPKPWFLVLTLFATWRLRVRPKGFQFRIIQCLRVLAQDRRKRDGRDAVSPRKIKSFLLFRCHCSPPQFGYPFGIQVNPQQQFIPVIRESRTVLRGGGCRSASRCDMCKGGLS